MKYAPASALVVFLGCAAGISSNVDVTYSSPELGLEELALLPVTAGAGLEGFRRTVAQQIEEEIPVKHPNLKVVSASESLRLLNDAGLAGEYSSMLEAYERTGVLDKETLARMGEALGVEHMMQVKISFESDRVLRRGIGGLGAEERQEVFVFSHIWSATEGDVVWEATGGAESETGDFTVSRDPDEVLAAAITEFVDQIPAR